MSPQPAPVSDHARRTARRIATLLDEADALLITAGSGLSAECIAPDDEELQQCQARFDYRRMQPHEGYRMLRTRAQVPPHGCFVVTTNIDGQFFAAGFTDWQVLERHGSLLRYQCVQPCCQEVWNASESGFAIDPQTLRATGDMPRCPRSGALARPNVLMYDDTRWVDVVRNDQQRRFDAWLAGVRGKRLVVVELGAGEGVASVRRVGERLLERSRVSLVRINPTATEADEPLHVLRLPALAAIRLIHEFLPDGFGGASAAAAVPPRPEIVEVTTPMRLSIGSVTGIDLGRGLVATPDIRGFGQDEDFAFLERFGEAQSGWVPVPPCGGIGAPGYTMTARVLRSSDGQSAGTAGAAIVFVQAPDEQAVATFGIGRRRVSIGTPR